MGIFDGFFSKKQATVDIDKQVKQIIESHELNLETKSFELINNQSVFAGNTLDGLAISDGALQKLYMTELWVYSAISSIATTISDVPWKAQSQKTIDGKVSYKDDLDSALNALIQYPNVYASKSEFLSLIIIDLLTVGNAYVYLEGIGPNRKQYRMPSEMYRLNPALIQIVPSDKGPYIEEYKLNSSSANVSYDPKEILHIRLPNPQDPYKGVSPLVPAFRNIFLDRLITDQQIGFYKNGARVGGVIKTSKNLTKQQLNSIQRSFENNYAGHRNQHRTLVLPSGMEYDTIQANAVESQLIEYAKYNRDAIISALKVPPIKLGFLEQASFSNAEIQEKFYYTDTILPMLGLIEDSFNNHPFITPPDASQKVVFDTNDITALREDYKSLAETAKMMMEGGLSTDEVREIIWKKDPVAEKYPAADKPRTTAEVERIQSDAENTNTEKPEEAPSEKLELLDEKQIDLPSGDLERISDIVDPSLSFEDRVAALTAIYVQQGLPVDQAARAAVERAIKEKGEPSPKSSPDTEDKEHTHNIEVQGQLVTTSSALNTPDHTHTVELGGLTFVSGPPKSTSNGGHTHSFSIADIEKTDKTKEEKTGPDESIFVGSDELVSVGVREEVLDEYTIEQKVTRRPGESVQQCVARGIPKLLEEGMPKDQAIAAAHAMCQLSPKSEQSEKDYSHIDFTPPKDVAEAAKRGLELREEYGRGGTDVGVARARDLSNRRDMSPDTIQRMVSFFARHEDNKDTPPEEGNGMIAWLLWGGDPGKRWAEKVQRQMEAADNEEKDVTVENAGGYDSLSSEKKELMDIKYKKFMDETEPVIEARQKELGVFFDEYKKLLLKGLKKELKKHKQSYLTKANEDELKKIISLKELDEFIEEFIEGEHPSLSDAYEAGYSSTLPDVSISFELTDEITKAAVKDLTLEQVRLYDDTTRSQINSVLKKEFEKGSTITEIGRSISNKFKEISDGRAQTIARTEILSAYSEAEELRTSEIEKALPEQEVITTWITMLDADVRSGKSNDANHRKLHGVTKSRKEKFDDGASKLRYPRDRKGTKAESVINCRCTTAKELVPKKP